MRRCLTTTIWDSLDARTMSRAKTGEKSGCRLRNGRFRGHAIADLSNGPKSRRDAKTIIGKHRSVPCHLWFAAGCVPVGSQMIARAPIPHACRNVRNSDASRGSAASSAIEGIERPGQTLPFTIESASETPGPARPTKACFCRSTLLSIGSALLPRSRENIEARGCASPESRWGSIVVSVKPQSQAYRVLPAHSCTAKLTTLHCARKGFRTRPPQ